MERAVDKDIRRLKDQILAMGGLVERSIEEATRALIDRRADGFQRVSELEAQINRSHIHVDEECVKLLARQSPLAADLRLVVAVLKINSDLERMGDQAINIANNGRRYLEAPPLKELDDLPQMAAAVRTMVRTALDAFVAQDEGLARQVLERDDMVDELKDKIFHDVKAIMVRQPSSIDQALNLILIARNLERLGDHATNIAEDVIFAVSGQDIRHSGSQTPTGVDRSGSSGGARG